MGDDQTTNDDEVFAGLATPRRVAILRADLKLAQAAFYEEVETGYRTSDPVWATEHENRGAHSGIRDVAAERLHYLPPTEGSDGFTTSRSRLVGSVPEQLYDAEKLLWHRPWMHPKRLELVERLVAAVAIHLTEVGRQCPATQALVLRLLERDPSPSDHHRRAADVARRTVGPWSDLLRRSIVDALEAARAARREELRRRSKLRRVMTAALVTLIAVTTATSVNIRGHATGNPASDRQLRRATQCLRVRRLRRSYRQLGHDASPCLGFRCEIRRCRLGPRRLFGIRRNVSAYLVGNSSRSGQHSDFTGLVAALICSGFCTR